MSSRTSGPRDPRLDEDEDREQRDADRGQPERPGGAPAEALGLHDRVDEHHQPRGHEHGAERRRTSPARSALDSVISRADSTAAAAPTGTLTKKIHSQLSASMRMPPSSRPKAPPPAAIALQTPSALVRSGPSGKVVVMIESAAGETSAPPRPCSARKAISCSEFWASPLSRLATRTRSCRR